MKNDTTVFVGSDVHKEFISVAYVPHERSAEVTYIGSIGTRHTLLTIPDTYGNPHRSQMSPGGNCRVG